jgi:hypothetical protein
MTEQPRRKPGRPPAGTRKGRSIMVYLSQPREELFEEAFRLLKSQKRLPITAELNNSRTEVIDYALEALLDKLRQNPS